MINRRYWFKAMAAGGLAAAGVPVDQAAMGAGVAGAAPVADGVLFNAVVRFTWVVVHAWSRFKSPGDKGMVASRFKAARRCAAAFSPNIKVVSPRALARLLLAARH